MTDNDPLENTPEDLSQSFEAMPSDPKPEEEPRERPKSSIPDDPETPPPPKRIIEALLFVGGPPLNCEQAANVIRNLSPEQFQHAIDELNREYKSQARPYGVHRQDGGYVLRLNKRYRNVIERLHGGVREAQLSQAAIDVLSLVAYRQPATKHDVDSLRGIESASVLRQLVRRGLIAVVQRGQAGQEQVAYGTTPRFLELFGLSSLDDLPRTHDIQQI